MEDYLNTEEFQSLPDEDKLSLYDRMLGELSDRIVHADTNPWEIGILGGSPQGMKSELKSLELKRKLVYERLLLPDRVKKSPSIILGVGVQKKENNQVFIAIQFVDSLNDSIKAIESGVKEAGLIPMCLKEKIFTKPIMLKALDEIRNSRFVIVDLTNRSNSVSFEAGFSYALGIPCIFVYKKDTEKNPELLEFYSRQHQCHAYDNVTDLQNKIREALLELKKEGI